MVTAEALDAHLGALSRLSETRLAAEMELQKQAALQRELQKWQSMDELQRRILTASTQLREQLNEQCPRCGAVFSDFNGCCALTCHRCGCGFCAWCLEDCGVDAHVHVADCPRSLAPGRGVFSSLDILEDGRRARRHENIVSFLSALPRDVARAVASSTEPELRDVGLEDVVHLFR